MCCLVGPDRNGEYARMTEHDMPIIVDKAGFDGTYSPARPVEGTEVSVTMDTATDNLEIITPLNEDTFSADDIDARIFDNLPIVWFATDWGAPSNVAIVLLAGTVGRVRQISDVMAQIEIRGLKDKLQTVIVDTWGATCKAKFGVNSGEWPCDVDAAAFTETIQITSIDVQRRVFTSDDLLVGSPPFGLDWFTNGTLTWTTGASAGYSCEIQSDNGEGQLAMFEPFHRNFEVGDEADVVAGCDRSFRGEHGCKKFGPGAELRFMGEPDIPGQAEILRGAA
jgi:uncharacterized phage protein (TIGR02218 family)